MSLVCSPHCTAWYCTAICTCCYGAADLLCVHCRTQTPLLLAAWRVELSCPLIGHLLGISSPHCMNSLYMQKALSCGCTAGVDFWLQLQGHILPLLMPCCCCCCCYIISRIDFPMSMLPMLLHAQYHISTAHVDLSPAIGSKSSAAVHQHCFWQTPKLLALASVALIRPRCCNGSQHPAAAQIQLWQLAHMGATLRQLRQCFPSYMHELLSVLHRPG